MKKLKDITFKYGLIFLFTGITVFLYSKIVFNYVENIDIGNRFKSKGFYESDLFAIIGMIQIFTGLLYLLIYFKGKFYLIDKFTIRTYWFTIPLILSILMIPVLDKYYPTKDFGNTILTKIIDCCFIISTFLFFGGIYYYMRNFIKSIYAYFKIKKGWKN